MLLGVLRVTAWVASLVSLAVAIVIAIAVYGMPVGQALLAGSEGAAFGFFPILWIVTNAIWVYQMTVETGHFDGVLVRSFDGGAGRIRHARGGHVGHADRARLQATEGGRARAYCGDRSPGSATTSVSRRSSSS